jgi:hypothetical protein
MKVLFYHVYLTDDPGVWSSIVLEQLKCMEDSGLLDALNQVCVTTITQNTSRIHHFVDVLHPFLGEKNCVFNIVQNPYSSDDEMIKNIESEKTATENLSMRWIYEQSKLQDMQICYAHTKGVTSLKRHLMTGDHNIFMKNYYWRQYLNWGVLEKWRDCVDALKDHDVAGVNYLTEPAPHYSGGFWWTDSAHIRTLADPATTDWWQQLKRERTNEWLRHASDSYRDEQWICSRPETKAFSLSQLSEDDLPTNKILRRKTYDAKTI